MKFDVYIPPSLQVKETEDGSADIFLYGTRMYLIKTDIKTNIDSKEQSVMAYYHDLGRSNINLRDGDGLKTIIKNLKDEISEKRFFDMFETYTPLGDGSFRVEIPILKMGRKDKKFKRAVKKKLGPSALLNI